jgi:CHAT domain-containing protein
LLLRLRQFYRVSERKRKILLERHPELLSKPVDDLIRRAIANAFESGDEESVRGMEHDRLLLWRCREIGIRPACAEIKAGYLVPIPPTLGPVASGLFEQARSARASADLPAIDEMAAKLESIFAHSEWPSAPVEFKSLAHHAVGMLFSGRYKLSGEPSNLQRAIDAFERSIAVLPPGWLIQTEDLNNLGNALLDLYELTGQAAELDRAVRTFEEGLACTKPTWSQGPRLMNGLATTLRARFEFAGNVADLDRAIELLDQVAAATGQERLSDARTNLGSALLLRYDRTGEQAALERSIAVLEEALQLAPGRSDRPPILSNLAGSLRARYRRGGELSDLERSIELSDEALALVPSHAPDRPAYVNDLGAGLQERYARDGDIRDLQRAIVLYEKGLAQAPPGSQGRLELLTNLAGSLEDRYVRTGQADDINRAVQAHTDSMRDTLPGSPRRARRLAGLGNALSLRANSGDSHDLDLAIEAYEEAVNAVSPDSPERAGHLNNLATAIKARHGRTHTLADLTRAMNLFKLACIVGLQMQAEAGLIAARNWGGWASQRQRWNEAEQAYDYALTALDQLFRTQIGRRHKETWLHEAQGVPAAAAYARAEQGKLESAVTVLELGRALILSETLELSEAGLERLAERGYRPQVERYLKAAGRLGSFERGPADTEQSPPERRAAELRISREELQAAISDIRAIEGYERFLDQPNFADAAKAAVTAPLVYLAATEAGGLGLVVTTAATVIHVRLPLLTLRALRFQVARHLQAYRGRRSDPDGWLASLDDITHWLWTCVMDPLLASLPPVTSAVLIPTGLLGLLPLHAAWAEDDSRPTGRRYALDHMLWTYAPNARALAVATRRAGSLAMDSLLAVDDPEWKTHPVPQADLEVEAALASVPRPRRLRHDEASKTATLAALDSAAVLHFACHGLADLSEPMDSALVLAEGERLTLREVLDRRLTGVRLAVLSACETAVPGSGLPDEMVGLPVGLLSAGASAVVGSLWSVADVSTMLVMVCFYEELRVGHVEPAEALRRAQCWVRDKNNAEKLAHFPDISALAGLDVPANFRTFWEAAQAHDHPYHWAAFTYIGT